ncbi:PepSY-associated TM helix domain-containing protein [Microbulbifer sp. JMSA003]|uniref:PepSY-associated TM helix domain-containing protein n=1 Tax=unclassified Microbulbifer TaxID=2619833 RepID=UPI004039BABF
MRQTLVLLHRYLGLATAVFLIVTGLTGAIISWDHELDEWLNPHLYKTTSSGEPLASIELAERLEESLPQVQISYFELVQEPGHTQYFWVEPRIDPATGQFFAVDYNQVFVDPTSGEIVGKREWGRVWPITTETLMSFLYKLHYSFHIPEFWGTDHWGIWLLGVIALVWTVDCFVGLAVTLPRRKKSTRKPSRTWWQRWKPAWMIKAGAGRARLTFDLHRAFSLWTWALLLTIAFTAFSLNLYREVFFPLMSLVSDVTPSPLEERTPNDHSNPITPALSFRGIAAIGENQAAQIGWQQPLNSLWYAREWGIYRAEFFDASAGHGAGGVGHKALFFDGHSGEYLGDFIPWEGTAADLFVQAQFPVHSGRILGLPGRILISIMGVVIAMLSVTGVLIWLRKRRVAVSSRVDSRSPLQSTAV